jgi:exopolyphosphatase / guanosine-5'-triphosphate,3'-diphosphate pyrophosphatase
MTSRIAIIDLGTNTFNLLVASVETSSFRFAVEYSTKQAVKLGEGGLTAGFIRPASMQRAKDTLTAYVIEIRERQCDQVLAIGTSAMRDAVNASELVLWAMQKLGLRIQVISGEEEAALITEGVRLAVSMSEIPMLIMDIGGGSTEFIIANATEVFWQRSYQLGISRIRQMLRPEDPLSEKDNLAFDQLLSNDLEDMLVKVRQYGVRTLIGSSGSFDSFMEMIWASKGRHDNLKEVLWETFDLQDLHALDRILMSMAFDERKALPGLVEMRVDTIHLASYMVQWVLRASGISEVVLSTYALKEGVLHRMMTGMAVAD